MFETAVVATNSVKAYINYYHTMQGSTHFVVTVVDENDNSPRFLDSNYMGIVIEEEDGATVIVVGSNMYQST